MLKAPKYFTMKVFVKSKEAKFYQKYFPFLIEAISIKQNSAGNGYMTLPNGEPAISSISIVSKEIKMLVSGSRGQHLNSSKTSGILGKKP